ncbi:serine/threonine-protein kinase [Sorangium cellulosum]|uniref:Protein kinase n=1 Tax=Sorangium cellulosum So0157-2 TaxID=1254432 RepID=S4XRX6_SORCE|nr:serine/threonine-protein kinase [Sorangium cellulosum]AGP35131.1 protein kinase [Sorangium cellulosum So0157-2]
MRPATVFLDRYRLERRAGAGGMGEVWKALDQETGEPVAVKLLSGGDPAGAARFAREAQILASLSHPRVVRYVAHGASADGAPYLVMEWLEGEDLAARLARGPLGADESVALALNVAGVLACAHAQGVIHRDLKPSNLFLPGGRLEEVKVLDFGIAQAAHATRMTRSGTLLGTPGYMAPEQARGEASIDARADVFSLGCVLFECVTGVPAFGGQHPAAILTKVLFEETPSARSVRPEVPGALDELLKRMLSKQREERPLDGQAAAEALRALGDLPSKLASGPSEAPSLTSDEQRAVAVILVSAPADADAQSFNGISTLAVAPDDATLLQEAEAHGGASERLLDGSVAVVLAGRGLATDLAALAARCALALRVRAGGRRVVLAMGRGDRKARSLGPAIERAARLSAATDGHGGPEGAVVIDEAVAGLLDARFDVREGEGIFTLHGERPVAGSTRLLLGRATPCVGRERELGTLRALLAETVEEATAQAALVMAPPGVGKSRLAHELLQELGARGEPLSVWIARGDALRAGSPLEMLGQALRSACGIHEGEPLEIRREKLSAQVAARVAPGEQRRVSEFLGEVVGAPFPDDESLPLRSARRDAPLMADQVRAAFLDFLGAASAQAPVLVLLEDLHWGDRPTVQLLDAALRALHERPIFVLALARPEVRDVFPRLWDGRRLHELRLVELSRRAGERLAQHVLGERTEPELIARIVRLSEGNAFYLEELIRWAAEGKGSHMPETVVAMVESRLGALDEAARRLLRAASIFGEVFWVGSVAALVGGEARRSEVARGLAALVEREILVRRRESRFPGEDELAFRHALLREGAYATLTEGDRALGHKLAGAWLEQAAEPAAAVVAEHFDRGGDPARAADGYRRAAAQALAGNDLEGVFSHTDRALALGAHGEARGELAQIRAEAHHWRGDIAEALRWAQVAMESLPRGSARWYVAVGDVGQTAGRLGHHEQLVALADELSSAWSEGEATGPAVMASTRVAVRLFFAGSYDRAEALHARIQAVAGRFSGDPAVSGPVFRALGVRARFAGHLDRCRALIEASLRCFEQAGDIRNACVARGNLAEAEIKLGAYAEAVALLRGAVADAERMGLERAVITGRHNLGFALGRLGALEEGLAVEAEAVAAAVRGDWRSIEGVSRAYLAWLLRSAGELEAAEVEARRAVALLEASRPFQVVARATLAEVMLSRGQPSEALAEARDAIALLASLGKVEQGEELARLVYARALEAIGDRPAARAAIADARDRLLATAARIDDPRRREGFLENVSENAQTLKLAREWLGDSAVAPAFAADGGNPNA